MALLIRLSDLTKAFSTLSAHWSSTTATTAEDPGGRYSSTSTPSCFSSWRFLSAPIPAPIPAPIAVAASSGGANSPTTSPAPPPQAAPCPTDLSPCSSTSTLPLVSRFITTAPTTWYSPASSPDLSAAKSSAAAPASAYEPTTRTRLSPDILPPSVIGRDDASGRSVMDLTSVRQQYS